MTKASKDARKEYIATNKDEFLETHQLEPFDVDWFPSSWLVFVYMGGASDQPHGEANPFKPRGAKAIIVEELLNLEEISSQTRYKSKKIRRSVKNSLTGISGETIDLASTPTASVSVSKTSHHHSHSFKKNNSETKTQQLNLLANKVAVLKKYKESGHKIPDTEIFEAEAEHLAMIRSIRNGGFGTGNEEDNDSRKESLLTGNYATPKRSGAVDHLRDDSEEDNDSVLRAIYATQKASSIIDMLRNDSDEDNSSTAIV